MVHSDQKNKGEKEKVHTVSAIYRRRKKVPTGLKAWGGEGLQGIWH